MKLIITRHGQTKENFKGIIQGHLPGQLSELGFEQARKVALRLKDEKIDFIYSSDLARAADTAKEIAKYHANIPIIFDKRIRERCFGIMEGKPRMDFDKITKKAHNAESVEELIKRTDEFLNELKKDYSNKSILIVGHGGSVGALLANLQNKEFKEIVKMGSVQNTSITIFDPVPEMKLFNCIQHLDG